MASDASEGSHHKAEVMADTLGGVMREDVIAGKWAKEPRKVWLQSAVSGHAKDCLVFLDGELYTQRVRAAEILRQAQEADQLHPLVSVFVSSISAVRRHTDFTCNESYASFVAELPEWIQQQAGTFDRFFLCGLSLSGLQVVFTALRHAGIYAGVLSQSPSAWWQHEWLTASLGRDVASAGRFWISVGNQELQENVTHPPTGLFQRVCQLDSVRRLACKMSDAGHRVRYAEFEGGHDPMCWGGELPHALAWLLDDA